MIISPRVDRRHRALVLFIAFIVCASFTANSQTFNVLLNFGTTNGAYPYDPVVQGRDGNLCGTTYEGGATDQGVIFRLDPQGTFTLLHSFRDKDGRNPTAWMLLGTNGSFYSTSYVGGAIEDGTVYKMNGKGKVMTLYTFSGADGEPTASRAGSGQRWQLLRNDPRGRCERLWHCISNHPNRNTYDVARFRS